MCRALLVEALACVEPLGPRADLLGQLARRIVDRRA
jgi:hypothetical protein